jgi:rhodanese-related sulfurtransferase
MKGKYSLFVLLGMVAFAAGCSVAAAYQRFGSDSEVPRISIQDAKAAFDAGEAVIVDSRAKETWGQERIAGSVNVPPGSGEQQFAQLPKGKKIIVYCSCGNEHTSAALAFQMNQSNVSNVYAMVGGTNAWKTAGYPMEGSEVKK